MNDVKTKLTWMFIAGIVVGFIAGYFWTSARVAEDDNSSKIGASVGEALDEEAQEDGEEMQDIDSTDDENSSGEGSMIKEGEAMMSPKSVGTEAVTADDQPAGTMITIAKMNLPIVAWIAIHENDNGVPGWILGARRFEAGETTGLVELLRGTIAGKSYFAVIHAEDGDGAFNLRKDLPIVNVDGAMILDGFTATGSATTE